MQPLESSPLWVSEVTYRAIQLHKNSCLQGRVYNFLNLPAALIDAVSYSAHSIITACSVNSDSGANENLPAISSNFEKPTYAKAGKELQHAYNLFVCSLALPIFGFVQPENAKKILVALELVAPDAGTYEDLEKQNNKLKAEMTSLGKHYHQEIQSLKQINRDRGHANMNLKLNNAQLSHELYTLQAKTV